MDFSGSCVSSSQFSVHGGGSKDEPFIVFDNICIIYSLSSRFPYCVYWPLVYWYCFSFGLEKARDTDNCPKLCGKLGVCIKCFKFSVLAFLL